MEVVRRAKWYLPLLGGLLLLVLTVSTAQAQSPEGDYDEAQAQAIDRMIMCPVCPAESIDQAQVPIARQMRQLVREKLAQGESPQEILDYFAATYGPDILASPPKSGINLLAWILPVVAVLAALIAGIVALRAMTSRSATAAVSAPNPPDSDLEPYLSLVDRQLDLSAPENNPDDPASETSDASAGRNPNVEN